MASVRNLMAGVAIAAATLISTAAHATSTIAIYDGYDGSYSFAPLSNYFTLQGYTVTTVGPGSMSLAGADLAILAYPVGMGASDLAAIDSYVAGGGKLIMNTDGAGHEGAQGAMNAILASLGSSMTNIDGAFDGGYHNTTNIVAGPYTTGVSSLNYGYTSEISGGNPVAYGNGGQLFIAWQQIGSGRVMAIADLDTADSATFNGDNPTLYCNFGALSCGASPVGVPEPGTWAMMLVGFTGMGALLRTGRRKAAIAVA